MLRIIKWILLVPVLLLLGYIAADAHNMAAAAHKLTGVDATACGATPNHDWESVNPFGCRYRFNLAPGEFNTLCQQQLISSAGWTSHASVDVSYPSLNEVATDGTIVYTNHDLPTRVRWVVYNPSTQLLYLGYYFH